MKIIYEDEKIIVVHKDAGEPTQTARGLVPDLVSKIKVYLSKNRGQKGEPYVGVVHRLDQPVEGLLVFAKDKNCAAALSRQVNNDLMNKIYTATVEGVILEESEKVVVDYMYKDSKDNKAIVVSEKENGNSCQKNNKKSENSADNREIKRAELSFGVISTDSNKDESVLRIHLKTGRFHQIRAQLSHMGHPIAGDVKYGAKKRAAKGIGLVASEIEFIHPVTKKQMHFEI